MSSETDREHSRMLYVISEVEGAAKLWGFTRGNLWELSRQAKVTVNSKIVPFFAPASQTQVVILEPVGDFLRIYEHSIEEDEEAKGESIIRMKLIKKVLIPNMSEIINTRTCHTAVSTKNDELLILFDDKDMHIFDMRDVTLDRRGGYVASKMFTRPDVFI